MENVKIEQKHKRVIVNVNTKFYPYRSILKAVKLLSETCWVAVDGNPEETISIAIKPKEKSINLNTIGHEFFAYLLAVMRE